MAKETVFRKQIKQNRFSVKTGIEGMDTTYSFELAPIAKNLTDEVQLFLETEIKGESPLSFILNETDAKTLYEALGKTLSIMDEMKEVNMNVLERFKLIETEFNEENIEYVEIELTDENPRNDNSGVCTFKVTPFNTSTCNKFYQSFYVNMYLTGVLSLDKKTFNLVLPNDIKIKYTEKMERKGKRYVERAHKESLESMQNRMKK